MTGSNDSDSDMGNFGIAYYDGGQESDLIDVDYGDLSALRTEWNFGEYLVLTVAVIFFASVFGFLVYTCYRDDGGLQFCIEIEKCRRVLCGKLASNVKIQLCSQPCRTVRQAQ